MKKIIPPTKAQLLAAKGKTIPDVIAPGLKVLFSGINPSLYSAAVGHHFARPGNRFWKTLHGAGFTPRLLAPQEDRLLIEFGCGITNVVDRATAAAAEVTPEEFRAGKVNLIKKLRRYRPQVLAVLGIGAFRAAFDKPEAVIGPQPETIHGTRLWVLPNPSGLNANYLLDDLISLFRTLRERLKND